MASDAHGASKPPSPEPIPLQDLSRDIHDSDEDRGRLPSQNPTRQRSLLRGGAFTAELGRRISSHRARRSYGRIPDQELPVPRPEDPDLQDPGYANEHDMPTVAELKGDFEGALGRPGGQRGSWLPPRNLNDPVSLRAPPEDDTMSEAFPDEGETAHLTDAANQQPMSGFSPTSDRANKLSAHDHAVRFGPGSSLGDDLNAAEEGMSNTMMKPGTRSRSGSLLSVLSVDGGGPSRSPSTSKSRSLSPASSPVRRVSVAVQNMSQRVVNLSNDPQAVEQAMRRRASSKSHHDQGFKRPSVPEIEIHPYNEENATQEKAITPLRSTAPKPWYEQTNPLKGNALRIFPPNHPIRLFLCDVLIHPATEPLILLLILIQTILLTIDAAPSVFNDPRSRPWGTSPIDYAMLVLFSIYTVEIIARCIVSGFLLNPRQDGDPNARGGLRRRIVEKGQRLLSPRRHMSNRSPSPSRFHSPPSLLRSLTNLNLAEGAPAPATVQSQARFRLARRAFLRHSFNRLDFVAVCSYWISLGLCISGIEEGKHLYIFRMLSCLRILRLLGITSGTSVILRSLKKAAPLLVHVAFLIGFFWLIFAIIGVQSFKGSFRRTCIWVDPDGVQANYTQELQFCGGHLNARTGKEEPYIMLDGSPGAANPKGYICPANSFCVSDSNPYGGTVSFDNILQSLELVFVVMTSNTFSDLLYYTADSDYLAAALFFAAGIVILAFWLANLLIAVITSSFQLIREETSKSAFAAEDDSSSVHATQDEVMKRPNPIKRIYDLSHHIWVVVIFIGLVAQMCRTSDMSEWKARVLDRVELVVTLILLFEIIFRFASDWRHFHTKRRNLVDLFLAVMTSVMQLPAVHNSGRPYEWLTIFQIIRIYRVVWAVPVIRELLTKVLGNVTGLSNLLFFVIFLTFLCSLFAVQILRGDLPGQYDGDNTQVSFFTIYNAFLGMYQIFSSENWTTILYMSTDVQSGFGTGWISAMFFIGWFILGNFIVLNMFIAVIQENFDVTEDEKRMYQVKTFLTNKSYKAPSQGTSLWSILSRNKRGPEAGRQAAFEMLTKQAVVESFLDEGEQRNRQSLNRAAPLEVAAAVENLQMQEEKQQRFFQRWWAKVRALWRDKEPNPFYSFQSRSLADLAPTAMAQEVVTEQERRKRAQREYLAKHPNYNVSLFIFTKNNPIRRFCQRMVSPSRGDVRYDGLPPYTPLSYPFSIVVYCSIVAMVILACITTPLYQKEYYAEHGLSRRTWFTFTDMGFVALFTIESTIKIIADGLIWTPNAYLRGSWGIIDCVVLITLWISVVASLRNEDAITRAVGAFKALRALRLLNISGSTQDTFHSVVVIGGKKIISAAFVSLSLIIPFAIYGVNLFAGQLDSCNDGSDTLTNLTDCVHEYPSSPYNWDILAPRAVSNPYYSFDDFGSSLFILFQIVSQEGWIDVMFASMDIVGKGLQPQTFNAQVNALFFLAFNLLGAVFVLTLFVSVFMRNYTEQTGVAFLTSDQRTWLELRKRLRQVRPSKRPNDSPDSDWKSWCFHRATHKHGWWQRGMTVLFMFHGALLLLEYHPAPAWLDKTRDWLFLALTIVFVVNLFVRALGLSWTNFIKSGWDIYALLSVSGTLITTVLLLAGFSDPTFIQLQKLFLVSIVLLLIPRNNQLDHLFKTAAASLTVIGSLMATWFVLFLVYAIALTQTFGLTKIGENGNGNLNFRTVPNALIVLFRMTCGEGWNQIMSDFEVTDPSCVRGATFFETDCGSGGYARVLFVSWNILSMYIFVSMFISLIFESFSYVYQRSGDSLQVSREEIRKFKQAWSKFDPDGTGYISVETFPRLLGQLSGVFAMRIYEEPFTVSSILDDVRVDRNGKGRKHPDDIVEGIDLEALNRRIAMIPVHKIRRQRHTFTLFFEECLVSADKDYGVSFNSVLRILAHYKIINDNKSLRLEEYLRRRYRLQRVEEQVQRNVVTNFFLTLYWSKRFRAHRAGETTSSSGSKSKVATQSIPQIFVGDESEPAPPGAVPQILIDEDIPPDATPTQSPGASLPHPSPPILVPLAPQAGATDFAGVDPFASNPFAADDPAGSSGLRQRAGRRTPPDLSPLISPNMSPNISPNMSPVGSPRLSPTAGASGWHGGGSPVGGSPTEPGRRSRQPSEVAPQVVLEALDSSEWRNQIRSFIEGRDGAGSGAKSPRSPKSPS